MTQCRMVITTTATVREVAVETRTTLVRQSRRLAEAYRATCSMSPSSSSKQVVLPWKLAASIRTSNRLPLSITNRSRTFVPTWPRPHNSMGNWWPTRTISWSASRSSNRPTGRHSSRWNGVLETLVMYPTPSSTATTRSHNYAHRWVCVSSKVPSSDVSIRTSTSTSIARAANKVNATISWP